MAIKDFRAERARIFKIVASGSGGKGTPSLIIHSSSWQFNPGGTRGNALYDGTTVYPTMVDMTAAAGRDVELFVSGATGQKSKWLTGGKATVSDGGVTLIGGDLVVSGGLWDGAGVEFTHDYDWTDGGGKLYTTSSVVIGTNKYVDTLSPVVPDANFYVAGTAGSRGTTTRGTSVFQGDLVVSGTLYAEKQVIEVNESTTGSLMISGSLIVSRSIDVHGYKWVDSREKVAIHIYDKAGDGPAAGYGAIVWDNNDAAIYESNNNFYIQAVGITTITGSAVGINHVPADVTADDASFVVSGSAHSFDGAIKGTALFEGDTVISGGLAVWGARSSTESAEGGTISGSIHYTQTGLPYLVQGPGITVISGANGQITISNTSAYTSWNLAGDSGPGQTISDGNNANILGGTGISTLTSATDNITISLDMAAVEAVITGTFNVPSPSEFVTTASVSMAGELGFLHTADTNSSTSDGGADTYFFVSGSVAGKDKTTSAGKVAVFSGDTVISGTAYIGAGTLGATPNVRLQSHPVESWLDIRTQSYDWIFQASGSGARKIIVRPETDSLGAFQVQSASNIGNPTFTVDTTNQRVGIGVGSPDNNLHIHGAGNSVVTKFTTEQTGEGASDGVLIGVDVQDNFLFQHKESQKPFVFKANYGLSGIELLSVGGSNANKQVLVMSGGARLSADEAKYLDVGFYVSGSTTGRDGTNAGTALFGGDVGISGSLLVSGTVSSIFERGLIVNRSTGAGGDSGLVVKGREVDVGKELIAAKDDFVHILSGGLNTINSPNPYLWTDTSFYVSGAKGSKDSVTKGVSVFEGDAVISGTLWGGVEGALTPFLRIGGDALLKDVAGATQYLNFGATESGTGYGFRSNAGTMQFRNNGGAWSNFGAGTTEVTGTFNVPSPSEFVTTASVSLAGGEGFVHTADFGRGDTYFFVSGGLDSRARKAAPGAHGFHKDIAVFAGDVVISGTLFVSGATGDHSLAEVTPGGTISGSIHKTSEGLSYLVAGTGMSIVSGTNGQVTINSTVGSGEWSDGGTFIYPSDGSGVQTVVIGNATLTNADIILQAEGGAQFNKNHDATQNFEIMSDTKAAFVVSSSVDRVLILSGGASSTPDISKGTDVAFFVSGSKDINLSGRSGVSLFAGDVVHSGNIYIGSRIYNEGNTDSYIRPQANRWRIFGNSLEISDFNMSLGQKTSFFNRTNQDIDFVIGSQGKDHAFFVDANANRVLILSGGNSLSTDHSKAGDVSLYISGAISNDNSSTGGTSVFGGDVVFSGSINGGSPLQVGGWRTDLGTDVKDLFVANTGGDSVAVFDGDMMSSGSVSGHLGLSGSLTRLVDGTSYLIAGTGVTIVSSSNGAVTINSTATSAEWTDETDILRPADGVAEHVGVGGTGNTSTDYNTFFHSSGGAIFNQKKLNSINSNFRVATNLHDNAILVRSPQNQVLILSGGSGNSIDAASALDVAFFVSGGLGSRVMGADGVEKAVSVFAGDVVISGSLFVSGAAGDHQPVAMTQGGTISGSIHQTAQGLPYLVQGTGVTIVSSSNGQVTISSTPTSAEWTDEGDILRPADGIAKDVGVGGTGNISTAYDIYFDSAGGAVFNQQKLNSANADFRVATNQKDGGIFVKAADNEVLILSGGSGNSTDESAGSDVSFYVSGSRGSRGNINQGTSVFGGDLVISGTTYLGHDSAGIQALNVYGNVNGDFVTLIDNDQSSNGHVLKLSTDGVGSSTKLLDMEDGNGDILFRARADGRFGFGPSGVGSMGAGTFVVGIDGGHTADIAISKRLQHLGDSNTYMDFPALDQIQFVAGGLEMLKMNELGANSQVLVMSGGNSLSVNEAAGEDVTFYVSGSVGSKSLTRGTSLFGGDAVISGALHIDGNNSYGGSTGAAIVLNTDGSNKVVWDTNNDGNAPDAQIYEGSGILNLSGSDVVKVQATNDILIVAQNGLDFAKFEEHSGQKVTRFNSSNADIDFRVANTEHDRAIHVDALEKTVNVDRKLAEVLPGVDINFYVSGTMGSRKTTTKGTSLFGGDLIVSGGMEVDGNTFVVDEANNRVGVGVDTPNAKMNISSDATGETILSVEQHSDTVDAPNFEFVKSRGTYAAPATINSGDFLGDVQFKAWDGNSEDQWAGFYVQAYGTANNTSHPAKLIIRSCADGSTSLSNAAIFNGGLGGTISGSIHQTVDGLSYLVAGDNVTIVSGTNGQVTIGATAGGLDADWKDGGSKLLTTSSVSIAGTIGDSHYANMTGADTFFFVSGSTGAKIRYPHKNWQGVATFGGDTVVSGALFVEGHAGAGTSEGAYGAAIVLNSSAQSRIVWDADITTPGLTPNALMYESGGTFHLSASDSIELKVQSVGGDGITLEAPTVVINEGSNPNDFRVESNNLLGAIIVDGDVNQVVLGANAENALSLGPGFGANISTILSGTIESVQGVTTAASSTGGTTLVTGDLVVSGAIYEANYAATSFYITTNVDPTAVGGSAYSVLSKTAYPGSAIGYNTITNRGVTINNASGFLSVTSDKQDTRQMLLSMQLNMIGVADADTGIKIREQSVGGSVYWESTARVFNNRQTHFSTTVVLPVSANPCITLSDGTHTGAYLLSGSTVSYRSI